jgi:hypothetical protein
MRPASAEGNLICRWHNAIGLSMRTEDYSAYPDNCRVNEGVSNVSGTSSSYRQKFASHIALSHCMSTPGSQEGQRRRPAPSVPFIVSCGTCCPRGSYTPLDARDLLPQSISCDSRDGKSTQATPIDRHRVPNSIAHRYVVVKAVPEVARVAKVTSRANCTTGATGGWLLGLGEAGRN